MDDTKFYVDEERLKANSACSWELDNYRNVFGSGRVFLTRENVERALTANLDVLWLAYKMKDKIADLLDYGWFEQRRDKLYAKELRAIEKAVYSKRHVFDDPSPSQVAKVFDVLLLLASEFRRLKQRAR